jgi:hypothetical protein
VREELLNGITIREVAQSPMRLRNAACGFALIYLQVLLELFISPTRLPQQSLEKAVWKDLACHAAFAQPLYYVDFCGCL